MSESTAIPQSGEMEPIEVAICEAIDPNWNKGAALVERMSLDRAERVLRVVAAYLTSDETVHHVENWVPLGYDYPARDPYPNVTEAARAFLAEAANVLRTRPTQPGAPS